MSCSHARRRWSGPAEFELRPALPVSRPWRYAEYRETCLDCGRELDRLRLDLRGRGRPGRLYRVLFDGRMREGDAYRLEAAVPGGAPLLVLSQSGGPGSPSFDVDPPIPCVAIVAAYEDDRPFALVRTSGPAVDA